MQPRKGIRKSEGVEGQVSHNNKNARARPGAVHSGDQGENPLGDLARGEAVVVGAHEQDEQFGPGRLREKNK